MFSIINYCFMLRPTIRVQVPKQDECLIDHLKQSILFSSPFDIFDYRVRICCFLLTMSVLARSNASVSALMLLVCLVPSHHSSFFFCPVLPPFSAYYPSHGRVHVFSLNYMFFPHFSSLLKGLLHHGQLCKRLSLAESLINIIPTDFSWTIISNSTSAHHDCQRSRSNGNKLQLNVPSVTPNTCDVIPRPQDLVLFCFDFPQPLVLD